MKVVQVLKKKLNIVDPELHSTEEKKDRQRRLIGSEKELSFPLHFDRMVDIT